MYKVTETTFVAFEPTNGSDDDFLEDANYSIDSELDIAAGISLFHFVRP